MKDKEQEKMKPFVFYFPSSGKGKIIMVLALVSVLLGISPIIGLVNTTQLVLGVPLMLVWVVALSVFIMLVLWLARKWGVH